MILRLDIERLRIMDKVRDFMAGSEPADFHLTDRRGVHDLVRRTPVRLGYRGLTRAHKGVVRPPGGEDHGTVQGADDAAARPVPQDRAH